MPDTIKQLKKQIDELQKEIGKLQAVAESDQLTELYNRHGFMKKARGFLKDLEWELQHKERRKILVKDFVIVFIDLDDFKFINDSFGHKAGDDVLKKLADFLRGNTKEVDLLGRWGGDEFIVGLVCLSKTRCLKIVQRLQKSLANHKFVFNEKDVKITASFGISSAVDYYNSLKTKDKSIDPFILVENADKAMYTAKQKIGKNFVVDYCKSK